MFTFSPKLSYAFTDLKVVSGEINRQICAFVESTAIITNFIKLSVARQRLAGFFSSPLCSRDFQIALSRALQNAKGISRLQHGNCRLLKNRAAIGNL
jgi:hypothetical protein